MHPKGNATKVRTVTALHCSHEVLASFNRRWEFALKADLSNVPPEVCGAALERARPRKAGAATTGVGATKATVIVVVAMELGQGGGESGVQWVPNGSGKGELEDLAKKKLVLKLQGGAGGWEGGRRYDIARGGLTSSRCAEQPDLQMKPRFSAAPLQATTTTCLRCHEKDPIRSHLRILELVPRLPESFTVRRPLQNQKFDPKRIKTSSSA